MPVALPSPERLRALLAVLGRGLIERDAAVRLALLAALAGEHVLLIGPPGSAKSELARRLHRAFAGTRYFERLLTRFSTPEELFGPLSLKALEDDRYERLAEGYLPTAGIAFLDEVFKANSAILNTLLALLNERVFDNGRERVAVPLVCVVGASNEVPSDEALLAFYDRFLVRVPVAPVSDEGFHALLSLNDDDHGAREVGQPIAPDERLAVRVAREPVRLSPDAQAALTALRHWLAGAGHAAPSDRRWRQLVALMKTAAATEGRDEVDALDLWLAPYVVAAEPQRCDDVAGWFAAQLAHAAPQDLQWLERAVEAFERQLEIEQRAPEGAADDAEAGKLALAQRVGGSQAGHEVSSMRLLSDALQSRQARRWSALHVRTRCAQVEQARQRAAAARDEQQRELEALHARVRDRLWWPPSLIERLLGGPRATLAALDALLARLDAVQQGFAALPVDDAQRADAAAPAPIALA